MPDRMSAPARRARILQLRAAGGAFPEIAAQLDEPGVTEATVRKDAAALYRARMAALESGHEESALELERLDLLQRRAHRVLAEAEQAHDRGLALRAIDRLLLVAERRAQVCPARPEPGAMEAAVQAEVNLYPAELRTTPLAVGAVLLARRFDAGLPSQDLAVVAREIRITLRTLGAKAPQEREQSTRDDLRKRREERITAEAAAAAGAQ